MRSGVCRADTRSMKRSLVVLISALALVALAAGPASARWGVSRHEFELRTAHTQWVKAIDVFGGAAIPELRQRISRWGTATFKIHTVMKSKPGRAASVQGCAGIDGLKVRYFLVEDGLRTNITTQVTSTSGWTGTSTQHDVYISMVVSGDHPGYGAILVCPLQDGSLTVNAIVEVRR